MLRPVAVGSVIVGLLASLAGSAVRLAHAPGEMELDVAAGAVTELWRDGDVLVLSPSWMLGARRRLGDRASLEAGAISEQALWRHRRAWVVTEPSVWGPTQPPESLLSMGRVVLASDAALWPPTVQLIELSHGRRVLFDSYRQVEQLTVTAFYADGQQAACDRWDRDRWSCPRDAGWSYVGRQILDIGGAPRLCLWLHPLAAGGRLEVALPPFSSAGETRLAGGYGFSANGARSARAPVHLSVRDAGQSVVELEHERSSRWQSLDVVLPETSMHEVVVTVTSRDNGAAHFCGDLFIAEEVL